MQIPAGSQNQARRGPEPILYELYVHGSEWRYDQVHAIQQQKGEEGGVVLSTADVEEEELEEEDDTAQDLAVTPYLLAFGIDDAASMSAMKFIAALFWTVDSRSWSKTRTLRAAQLPKGQLLESTSEK